MQCWIRGFDFLKVKNHLINANNLTTSVVNTEAAKLLLKYSEAILIQLEIMIR